MTKQETEVLDLNESGDEGDLVVSGSEYSPRSEFKKAIIALDAVQECRKKRATEMIKGFWNNRLDKQGNAIKTWVNDQRKEYINSVLALKIILAPELKRKSKYYDEIEAIEKSIKTLFDKFAYESYSIKPEFNSWERTGIKYIPQLDEEVLVINPMRPKELISARGGWDNKVNAYFDLLVPYYDEMFETLARLIDNLNDFKIRDPWAEQVED